MGQILDLDSVLLAIVDSATVVRIPAPILVRIGGQQYSLSADETMDVTTNGIGGLDTGSIAGDSLYYIHAVIENSVPGFVASLSKTLPTGFTFSNYIGQGFITDPGASVIQAVKGVQWDWVPFLADFTAGWNSAMSFRDGRWRRDGDTMEIQMAGDFSGAPSGTLEPQMVGGYSMAGPKLVDASLQACGVVHAEESGVGHNVGSIYIEDSTSFRVVNDGAAGLWAPTVPFTWGAGDTLRIWISGVPIDGWDPREL